MTKYTDGRHSHELKVPEFVILELIKTILYLGGSTL